MKLSKIHQIMITRLNREQVKIVEPLVPFVKDIANRENNGKYLGQPLILLLLLNLLVNSQDVPKIWTTSSTILPIPMSTHRPFLINCNIYQKVRERSPSIRHCRATYCAKKAMSSPLPNTGLTARAKAFFPCRKNNKSLHQMDSFVAHSCIHISVYSHQRLSIIATL